MKSSSSIWLLIDKADATSSFPFKRRGRTDGVPWGDLCQPPSLPQAECMLCKYNFKAHPLAPLTTKLPLVCRLSGSALVKGGLKHE